jgi:hypothetical protein
VQAAMFLSYRSDSCGRSSPLPSPPPSRLCSRHARKTHRQKRAIWTLAMQVQRRVCAILCPAAPPRPQSTMQIGDF